MPSPLIPYWNKPYASHSMEGHRTVLTPRRTCRLAENIMSTCLVDMSAAMPKAGLNSFSAFLGPRSAVILARRGNVPIYSGRDLPSLKPLILIDDRLSINRTNIEELIDAASSESRYPLAIASRSK